MLQPLARRLLLLSLESTTGMVLGEDEQDWSDDIPCSRLPLLPMLSRASRGETHKKSGNERGWMRMNGVAG